MAGDSRPTCERTIRSCDDALFDRRAICTAKVRPNEDSSTSCANAACSELGTTPSKTMPRHRLFSMISTVRAVTTTWSICCTKRAPSSLVREKTTFVARIPGSPAAANAATMCAWEEASWPQVADTSSRAACSSTRAIRVRSSAAASSAACIAVSSATVLTRCSSARERDRVRSVASTMRRLSASAAAASSACRADASRRRRSRTSRARTRTRRATRIQGSAFCMAQGSTHHGSRAGSAPRSGDCPPLGGPGYRG
ncbi:hypothetical protein AES38_07135 [Clavibacter capsici]|nr:hypothetical protein AES38_07135 [Clavibacter capsici]